MPCRQRRERSVKPGWGGSGKRYNCYLCLRYTGCAWSCAWRRDRYNFWHKKGRYSYRLLDSFSRSSRKMRRQTWKQRCRFSWCARIRGRCWSKGWYAQHNGRRWKAGFRPRTSCAWGDGQDNNLLRKKRQRLYRQAVQSDSRIAELPCSGRSAVSCKGS